METSNQLIIEAIQKRTQEITDLIQRVSDGEFEKDN